MLAHQLEHVRQCPVHEVPLLERCGKCNAPFSNRYTPRQRMCCQCGAKLWQQSGAAYELSVFASWCQTQILNLVAFATDPDSDLEETWSDSYVHSVVRLSEGADNGYTREERRFIRNIAEHHAINSTYPSIGTLLRIASIQATSLVEYLKAPVELGSPRLFNIGGVKDPGKARRNKPSNLWKEAHEALKTLLLTEETVLLPSKRELLSQVGVSASGLWQHDPELSVQYDRERRRRAQIHQGQSYKRAVEAAQALIRDRNVALDSVNIRREGATLMASLGISKHLAESALHSAITTQRIAVKMRDS
jgi:hypothetical protein